MAKKSSAALSVVKPLPRKDFAAPDDLSMSEAELWRHVVESKPAEWFGEDSAPLLKEYVRAATMCDLLDAKVKAVLEDGSDGSVADVKLLLDMRDKESRRAMSLATKLRLTQQSRYTPQAASTANRRASGKRPWQS